MSVGQTRKTAGTSYPEVSSRFRLFPRVGQGVGQDKRQSTRGRVNPKEELELYPQYPSKYAKHKQREIMTTLCRATAKVKPTAKTKSKETAQSYGFSDFGGGEWIRTTEVVDNRFTVCPLWPLGNSPINVFNFWCRQPAGISANDFHAVRARLACGGTPLELVNGLEPLTC